MPFQLSHLWRKSFCQFPTLVLIFFQTSERDNTSSKSNTTQHLSLDTLQQRRYEAFHASR